MHQDIKEILVTEKEIEAKIRELGASLKQELGDSNPLCICILKGAVPFMAELVRAMDFPLEIDFMAVSSYGNSTKSSGVVRILKDLEKSIEGRHILIVEDIVDTGLTLSYLVELLKARQAASVRTVTLLNKPSRRTVDLVPDYNCFEIPDHFVVGFGLDYQEKYRNLSYIGVLKPEVYQT